jgi:hypothetical protein
MAFLLTRVAPGRIVMHESGTHMSSCRPGGPVRLTGEEAAKAALVRVKCFLLRLQTFD